MATSIDWSRYGMNVADPSMDPAQWAENIQDIFSKIHDPSYLLKQPRHYIPVFVLHRFCKAGRERPWVPQEKDRKQEIAGHIIAQRKLGPSLPSWRLYGNEDKLADDDTFLVYNTKTKKYDKLHWSECFKTDAPYSKFFEKFTQRDLAMDKWTFKKFETLMKADKLVMESLCLSANILFDALTERETKGQNAITLKRGDIWDMRKYFYLLSTLRNRDRNTHLLGTSKDMEDARAKRKKFMEEKQLGHARDLWLHNVDTILNTPHYQIGTSAKIFEFDRDDYRTNARERFMVFWEAGPNDEFLLTDNSFGCFEGCRVGSKHGMTVGMKPSDIQKRLYTREFMWHQLFVLSPKLVVALCHGSLMHPAITKAQRTRYGLRPSILQNLPHPLPHNYYKDLHPDECRFMKQGWEVPEELEDHFGRKSGNGKHVVGIETKATNEIEFQITTLSSQQVALVNMILLLNQSSLTGVDNVVYRNPAAIYRAITEYEKQEWDMYTDEKQNSYKTFRKKIYSQFNKGHSEEGGSESPSPQATSPNPNSRGMTPSHEPTAERMRESRGDRHKSGTATPAERKQHQEANASSQAKPPLEKKDSERNESSRKNVASEAASTDTTESKPPQKPRYDDAMDGIRVSGSSDVIEEAKPSRTSQTDKSSGETQKDPQPPKAPEVVPKKSSADIAVSSAQAPKQPQEVPSAPQATQVPPAPQAPPAPEAPPAPQSISTSKTSNEPQAPPAPPAAPQAPPAPQIPEVRTLPPETPTKSEFSSDRESDSEFYTETESESESGSESESESEDEDPRKLVVALAPPIDRQSSTKSRKSTDKSERSIQAERRDRAKRERAHSEKRERLEKPERTKNGSTKSDDRPRRSRSKGDVDRMALVRPDIQQGSRSDRGSGQRSERERLRREREAIDRLNLQREKERLARQKLEFQMNVERLERQTLEKERERLERQKFEMERMELERQKRELAREREELHRKEREREQSLKLEKEKDMIKAAKIRKEKVALRQEKEKLAKIEEKRQMEKARERELKEQQQRERERELNERLESERLQRELENDRDRDRRHRERQDRERQKHLRHERPDKSDTSEEYDRRDRKVRRRKSMVHSSPSSEPAVPARPGFEPEITPPSSSHSHPDNVDNGFDPRKIHRPSSPPSAPYSPPLKSPPVKSGALKSPPLKSPPIKSPTSPSGRRHENALMSPTHDAAQKLLLQLNVNNPQLALAPYQPPQAKKEKDHNRRRSEIPSNVRRFETPVPLPPLDTHHRPQQHQRHQSYGHKPMLALTPGGESPAFSTLADNGDFEDPDAWEDEDYMQKRDDYAVHASRGGHARHERPDRAPAKPVKRLALEAPPVMRRKGSVVRLNTKARPPQGTRQEQPRRNPYY